MNAHLYNPAFRNLSMREVHPEGWLLNQLKIQASGLSGNLDKFWPDIKDSMWIGGSTEGWERVPYWLDGFIPLAWLLDDEDMKNRARYYVDYIIDHQKEDGWICPGEDTSRNKYDMWALFLILKVLVVYHDASGDERIEGVVHKALRSLDKHIDVHTLFAWAQTRWFECLIPIWWLYERTGEEWLIDLAVKLRSQGFDWQAFFKYWPYKESDGAGRWSQMSHVVNNAMMLKSGALWWRLTGSKDDLESTGDMVKLLDDHHGMVTGVFTGDECLAGTSPVHGTELCAAAEYMYSLEHLASITGRSTWGDRLERIAYNALPAAYSPDMWAHQYDQQINQIECSIQEDPIYYTNGGDSNLFALEPNFGCCTANLSQPWPKLALSTFMKCSDGLAAAVYAPCTISTGIDDAKVTITLETGYPFRDTLNFNVKTNKEIEFALYLRIPEWSAGAAVEIDGCKTAVEKGTFYKLKRKWVNETTFTLSLPMGAQLVSRPNNLYAVTRGPLVYSLAPGERWVRVNEDLPGREIPHCDYEVYATTPWNFGLCLNSEDIESGISFEEHPIGDCPFSPSGAPVTAKVKGQKVDWPVEKGSAAPCPKMDWVSGVVEDLTLIPYGCTNLRITEMPLV